MNPKIMNQAIMNQAIMNQTIAISTGGTGGHIFPAQALAQRLLKNGYKLIVLIDSRAEKFNYLWPQNINIHTVKSKGMVRGNFFYLVYLLFIMFIGFWQSLFYLIKYKPKVLISFGGYSAIPTSVAAFILNIKVILHEQNSVLGKANKLLLPLAFRIATSFNFTKNIKPKYFNKLVVTGLPIREEFFTSYHKQKDINKINVLILGGSLGAQIFSQTIPEAFLKLPSNIQEKFFVYHQCIKETQKAVQALWQSSKVTFIVKDFFNDIAEIMQSSNFILARSGASTVFEVAVLNKFAIFVPYKLSANNHQLNNAKYAKEYLGCAIIPEHEFNSDSLSNYLTTIANNNTSIYNIQNNLPNASTLLLQLIQDTLK